jgi:hypothetical protein
VEQIERQIRWEAGAVALGVRRYNAELTKRSLSGRQREFADTSLGQGYIRSIVGCLVPVIKETQETLVAPDAGTIAPWSIYVSLLDAETLAYLTLRSVLSEGFSTVRHARKVSPCAVKLAGTIELEVEFRRWQADQVKRESVERADGKGTSEPYRSLLARIRQATGGSNAARTWKRWRTRLDNLSRQRWGQEDKLQLGSNLIALMANSCPQFFALDRVAVEKGKTTKYIRLSEKSLQIIEDRKARAEVAVPAARPMLCRPKPWVWQETIKSEEVPVPSLRDRYFVSAGTNWEAMDSQRGEAA